ncbi:hypothetical protein MMC30_003483 [Trapelia coarctata]|nr:hypothetical protein [Trapelia coarctata]
MDRLPVEIIDNICAVHLPEEDLLNFRLVCRAFATIGIRHFLPEVSVAFLPQTFVRLKAISEHPVISQYIKSIVYQVDVLPKIRSFREYKHYGPLSVPAGLPSLLRPYVSQGVDARTSRRHRREMLKTVDERLQEFNKIAMEGWKCYRDLFRQQETLLSSDTPMKVLGSTLTKFPRLKKLEVQARESASCSMPENPFRRSLVALDTPTASSVPCGVQPLRDLLMSAFTAKTKLQSLCAGYVSFKFFDFNEELFDRTKTTLRHLHTLDMEVFSTDDRLPIAEDDENSEACDRLFDSCRFQDFLAAAPDLREIHLIFDWPVPMGSVFGDHRWQFLRRLELRSIETQEDVLLAFFKRHAPTLRELTLSDVTLTGPTCSFVSVFLKMPEILNLVATLFAGIFVSYQAETYLVMDSPVPWLDMSISEALDIVVCRDRLEFRSWRKGDDDYVRILRKTLLARILGMEEKDM